MSETGKKPTVSVLGVGGIGLPIARLWIRAGYHVILGSRSPEALHERIAADGLTAPVTTLDNAAAAADIALLAVPYPALKDVAAAQSGNLADTVVIDATNPMGLSDDGRIISTLDDDRASGQHTADLLPRSSVVRGFSHVMEELLWSRGTEQSLFWGMALAGDDPSSKASVAALVTAAGFVPVDIGSLAQSKPLDPGGVLFPHMFTPQDLRCVVGLDAASDVPAVTA